MTAKDGAPALLSSQPHSVTITVSIKVLDVNDNQPVFGKSPYTLDVLEDKSTGYVVGSVTATDADAGLNGRVVYSISRGNTGNR